jgi:hypothetical protein
MTIGYILEKLDFTPKQQVFDRELLLRISTEQLKEHVPFERLSKVFLIDAIFVQRSKRPRMLAR